MADVVVTSDTEVLTIVERGQQGPPGTGGGGGADFEVVFIAEAPFNASSGAFTTVATVYGVLPRDNFAGQRVLNPSGSDKGIWIMTASGPCTPVDEQPALGNTIVGTADGYVAVATTIDGTTINAFTSSALLSQIQYVRQEAQTATAAVADDLAAATADLEAAQVDAEPLYSTVDVHGAKYMSLVNGQTYKLEEPPGTFDNGLWVAFGVVPVSPLGATDVFAEFFTQYRTNEDLDLDNVEIAFHWVGGQPYLFAEFCQTSTPIVGGGEFAAARIDGTHFTDPTYELFDHTFKLKIGELFEGAYSIQYNESGHGVVTMWRKVRDNAELTTDDGLYRRIYQRVLDAPTDVAQVDMPWVIGLDSATSYVRYLIIRDGIDGTLHASPKADDVDDTTGLISDPQGNVWVPNAGASILDLTAPRLAAAGSYLYSPDGTRWAVSNAGTLVEA